MIIAYRPDIDGLRAIAVALVVFYHANIFNVTGGYIGVDVFFVISGYLITSIIYKEIQQGTFSLLEFYARRVRRIFPALFLVFFVSLFAAYFLFLPREFELFGRSLAAASVFGSNILFWRESGYFDSSAHLKPLLHTWSLGIEEQFYILFPLFLMTAFLVARRYILLLLFLGGMISIGLAEWGIYTSRAPASFFLLPTRAWELAIGACLALVKLRSLSSGYIAMGTAFLGLLAIILPAFIYTKHTSFPGLNALMPCIGTVLMIYGGISKNHFSLIIGHPVLAYFGRLSYALYLWHWPILVFYEYYLMEPLTWFESSAAILFSLLLSILTYHALEKYFKRLDVSSRPSQYKVFGFSVLFILFFLTVGIWVYKTQGMPERFSEDIQDIAFTQRGENWPDARIPNYYDQSRVLGDAEAHEYSFLVWGDSHATAVAPAITPYAIEQNRKGLLMTKAGCMPSVLQDEAHLHPLCVQSNQRLLEVLEENKEINTIYLIARWEAYPRWWASENGKKPEGMMPVFISHLKKTIQYFKDRNYKVILVQDIARMHGNVPLLMGRGLLFGKDIDLKLPRDMFEKDQGHISRALHHVAITQDIQLIQPHKIMCDHAFCYPDDKGHSLYVDSNHLSLYGAQFISPLFEKTLQ